MKPIGYWLRHLDGLIEGAFERALGAVTRREWQVLNVLSAGAVDSAGLVTALEPFPVGEAVESLVGRGWVEGEYALTATGRKAHAEIAVRVEEVRGLLVEGVGTEGYASVVRGLERMAGNLERELTGAGG